MSKLSSKAIDYASEPLSSLRLRLISLKKEEAELEIALSLRKYPSIEEAIVRLITCVVELGSLEKTIRLEQGARDPEFAEKQRREIKAQIDLITKKIESLPDSEVGNRLRQAYINQRKLMQEKFDTAGHTKTTIRFFELYKNTLLQLRSVYDSYKELESKVPGLNLFNEVPKLEHFLSLADDLISKQ